MTINQPTYVTIIPNRKGGEKGEMTEFWPKFTGFRSEPVEITEFGSHYPEEPGSNRKKTRIWIRSKKKLQIPFLSTFKNGKKKVEIDELL